LALRLLNRMRSFIEKVKAREAGICLYGIAPPKRATPPQRLSKIVSRQLARIRELEPHGLIVYDIQDEVERVADERPFPFLPTIDPHTYAYEHLEGLRTPKIVYRTVGRDDPASFTRWMSHPRAGIVLVGAPSRTARVTLPLSRAYALAKEHAPDQLVGGIAIAERHARQGTEHERMLTKMQRGCRFFVTQAVYDVTASKSLISDYALTLASIGHEPVPLILTFAPCASEKTLAFMRWLGISFPRWLENELKHARDPLTTSLQLCEDTFDELSAFARAKRVPIGINVESVSIRKAEIEASVELFRSLRRRTLESTTDGA
jgi:hypothetical protein